MGIVVTLLVLEACRRLTGPSLTTIALVTILYAFWGKYLPGLLGHKGYSLQRVVKTIFSDQGVFGMPIGVSANTVFLRLGVLGNGLISHKGPPLKDQGTERLRSVFYLFVEGAVSPGAG